MSRNILFISNEFAPTANGTVTCLENIIPFIGKDNQVSLFTVKINQQLPDFEQKYGINIYRVGYWADYFVYRKRKKIFTVSNQISNKYLRRCLIVLLKLLYYIPQRLSVRYGYAQSKSFQRNFGAYIEKSIDMKSIDTIMAIAAPFENVSVATILKEKYPNKKLALIEFDLYTYNAIDLRNDECNNKFQERLRDESKWLNAADLVVCAIETKESIVNSELWRWKDKYLFLFIPSLTTLNNKELAKQNKEEITIVYSGMFYRDIRNPAYMLRLFEEILMRDSRIKLHIVGFGCENLVNDFLNRVGERCVYYGKRDREFASQLLERADVLLNIGNRTNKQLPSKILEYIGMRKPIIHVYSIPDDTCLCYLEKYPMVHLVQEDSNIEKATDDLLEFIDKYRGKQCDYADIKQKYCEYEPDFFVSQMQERLNNLT